MRGSLTIVSLLRKSPNVYCTSLHRPLYAISEPPDCPSEVRATEVTSRGLTIGWTHTFWGNSPLTNYLLELRPELSASNTRVIKEVVDRSAASYVIKGLEPRTKYVINLIAVNAIGASDGCTPIKVTTEDEPPTSPPRDVKVAGHSSTTLIVSWRPPAKSSLVQGYYVGYRLLNSNEPFAYKTIDTSNSHDDDHTCTLTGLKKNSRYSILVQSFNAKGAGPASEETVAQTQEFGKLFWRQNRTFSFPVEHAHLCRVPCWS